MHLFAVVHLQTKTECVEAGAPMHLWKGNLTVRQHYIRHWKIYFWVGCGYSENSIFHKSLGCSKDGLVSPNKLNLLAEKRKKIEVVHQSKDTGKPFGSSPNSQSGWSRFLHSTWLEAKQRLVFVNNSRKNSWWPLYSPIELWVGRWRRWLHAGEFLSIPNVVFSNLQASIERGSTHTLLQKMMTRFRPGYVD